VTAQEVRTIEAKNRAGNTRIPGLQPIVFIALYSLSLLSCCRDSLPPPGVVVPDDPVQVDLSEPRVETMGKYEIRALASFSLEARVLAKERYWLDKESDVAPYDLALGWGPMSDSDVYGKLDIGQWGRWYHYQWGDSGPPIPLQQIINHSANMHIIPSDSSIKSALGKVKRHDVISLEGYLVEVHSKEGWRWKSSMSREDSGAGSCELFVVKKVTRSLPENP
jgi:hypothetical protein